jgi:hypothetical protein
MSGQARVESVDALKKFRAALCKFAETAAVGLDEAQTEIQRTRHWVLSVTGECLKNIVIFA